MPSGGLPAAATGSRPRLTERHVLALSLGVSGAFVVAAAVAAARVVLGGGGSWAALHLALAGAATVAIGAFMPHFAITLAGTRPSPASQRLATQVLLAAGSIGAVIGVLGAMPVVSSMGTVAMVAGLVGVAAHTLAPLREPLARRHPVVATAYGVALLELATGVIIGGLAAAGVPAVVDAWASLRPAHAWLTLFGAISLTIFATLVYLAPTVLGARIRAGWSLAVAVLGIGIGPIVAAAGFTLDARPLVLAGMAGAAVGAIGQVAYVLDARRRRGPYTSEHDWRSVAVGHLLAGPFWFAAAVAVALGGVLAGGPIAGWSLGLLALPLVAGWMLQELVGSWTHLVPSVTPGDPTIHARQRRVLAAASRTRLVAWNVGLGALWAGVAMDVAALSGTGGALLAGAVLASVALLGRSLTAGRY
jgi:nitrite reductase (NO-forming)